MIFPDMRSLQKVTRPLLLSYSSKKSTYNWVNFHQNLKKLNFGALLTPSVTFLQKLGFLNFLTLWLPNFMQKTGVDLTFQKWFLSFPNKNNCQTDLNVGHHGWARRNIFHSRSPLKQHFFYLFILLNNIKVASYTRRLEELNWIKKNWIKELRKKSFKNKLFRILQKPHLCFYKNSKIQTFNFVSSKVVYFKKDLTYQV